MSTIRSLTMAIALVTAAGNAAEGPLPAQAPASTPAALKSPAHATTMRELLAASKPSDWRTLDPDHTLYIELTNGRVVIELAPAFAPRHVANIETIARAHWYDGLAITRVQDNFVAQWGDPLGSRPEVGERRLPTEFTRSSAPASFVRLKDPDTYASEVGFADGFPMARSGAGGDAWLVHCYGMVGVGRDNDPATAIGTELYAVIGQAPRQLDRNAALVGRVVWGIELLASLPRGTGELGFYEQPEQRVPIQTVRVAGELPPAERSPLEVLRTDTPLFQKLIEIRRNRRDAWYKTAAGRIDLCNVPLPVREKSDKPKG
ncbi:MAG TPA: peptidylprolyl isomerase [Steroidobacteraceae bacterium]|nr:peptidylprolyl isomerase [Steroidobacteraceae bacterium]